MTVSGQASVVYSYDNANRLTQITQGSSIVLFGYDAAGRRTGLTLPNDVLVEYTYDAASRVTGINYKQGAAVLGNLTYEYDKAGNRTKIGGTFARTGIPSAITSSTYNAANRQTGLGDKIMTFDNNGNLTGITDASGTTIYSWNARNQLTGISGPGVSASFVYDGLGRREKKTVNSSLTEFLYDGVNPVQETSGATVLANILTGSGIDEFLTRTDVVAGTTGHFLPDALGSVLALADSAGTVQTEYNYEPFGRTTATGVSNTDPFQYTGRENDATGIYYYRARYYHPGLQRFISEDPIEFFGGDVNLYAYVWNNPTNLTDPTGQIILGPTITKLGRALILAGRLFFGGRGVEPPVDQSRRSSQAITRVIKPVKRALPQGIKLGLGTGIIIELFFPDEVGAGSDRIPGQPPQIIDIPPDDNPPPGGGRKDDDCPFDGTKCGPPAT